MQDKLMSKAKPHPPQAPKKPHRFELHGEIYADDYHWLRDRSNPEVIAYLEAENAYAQAVMAHTSELQNRLYREMRERIKENDLSVPVRKGNYLYYEKTLEDQQYAINCRRCGSMEGPEEILLDQNALAVDTDYFRLGIFQVSPDHKLLAYSTDSAGAEIYTLYFKNLETDELLADRIPNTYYSCTWASDSQTVYYTTLDEAMRPHRLYRHRLGTASEDDELIYQEDDERFYLGCHKTKSEAYILLTSRSKITSETWIIAADDPSATPSSVQAREQGVEYSVDHHPGLADAADPRHRINRFIITTNDSALNARVVETAVAKPSKEQWVELVPHRDDVKIIRAEAFRKHLVLYQRKDGLPAIHVINLQSGEEHDIQFPDAAYSVWDGPNPEFDSELLRFNYTSFVAPRAVYDYHMYEKTRILLKEDEVQGEYERGAYETLRLWATASDGVKVPISIVRRKDIPRHRPVPTLLYGYGSYEVCLDAHFRSTRLSLLDRGMTFAVAHVRGGGEMGRHWYEEGKLLQKKNTFTDFVVCAQHLIEHGYTSPELLVAEGRSAGGLLMGAVVNMRPDLFAGVVAGVPFVDVINTMLDRSIPLTVTEYEEWGNPNDPTFFEYMRSYSPYDNLGAQDYPNLLVTAGLNDPRVQFWEPAKYVARLRMLKTNENRLLLKTNMGAGHGGASGRFEHLKELAFEYAFILDVVGLAQKH